MQTLPKCKEWLPLSLLQAMTNNLFYKRADDALEYIITLSSHDKLLSKSAAKEYLANRANTSVHEIGPGNFNFAKSFIDETKVKEYNTHDFVTEMSKIHEKDIAPYPIKFNNTSILNFANEVKDANLTIYLSEILDDTLTDFFIKTKEGIGMLFCKPSAKWEEKVPTKYKWAKELAANGNFSTEAQILANTTPIERDYSMEEIIKLIEVHNIAELELIHPGFLRGISYEDKAGMLDVPAEQIKDTSWGLKINQEYENYKDEVIKIYKNQLEQAKLQQTVHLPIAGLHLIHELKNRKNVELNFFDYGYDSLERHLSELGTYNGQITAPVNFEIMKKAAELLGYQTLLERNSKFTERNLGINTISLAYLDRIGNEIMEAAGRKEISMEQMCAVFKDKIKELQPGAIVTPKNCGGYRIKKSDFDDCVSYLMQTYEKVQKEENLPKIDIGLEEGSYHLKLSK